jgi:UDP-N-acetylmuramate--alanine ligase
MLALAMEKAGLDPTVFVGTKIFEWQDKNFRLGKSPYLVVEACEYRNSFWHFKPKVAVLTSLEAEHLDFFETEENYLAAFKKFLTNAEILVADYSDEAIRKVSRDFSGIKYNTGQFVSQVPKLQIPGRHNVLNATKVFSVFTALDWDLKPAQKALADYQGSWRRSEYKGTKDDIEVYDDYAHHPTEVAATLTAFRAKYPERRIIAVFQPHQYSRTHQFLTQFAQSFKHADLVLIPEIYKVRDRTEDLAKVSGQDLVEKINNLQQEKASFTFDYSQTVTELHNLVSPGDLVLTMGAGPVNQVAEGFLGH